MDQYTIKRTLLKLSAPPRRLWMKAMLPRTPDALFLWIPKTAGTSVFTALTQRGMQKYKSVDKARCLFTGGGLVTFVHQSVPALVAAGAIDPGFVSRAIKFSFVRNPYDRSASLYRYYLKMNRIPADLSFPAFLGRLEEEWHARRALPAPPLGEMSDRLNYYGEEHRADRSVLYPVGPYNVLDWSQCRPQVDWLDGVAPLESIHLGRVESIDSDFKRILSAIWREQGDAPPPAVPRVNTTSETTNTRDAFADPALKRIVETVYARDFETFGY